MREEQRKSSLSHEGSSFIDTYTSANLAHGGNNTSKEEKKYGPTKIKIWHVWEPSEGIASHPVQTMFESYNEFIKIVFTQKHSYETQFKQRLPHLLKLAKKMGLSLHKG